MGFARTWSEELVREWLELEGYLVEVGVPIGTKPAGGRGEADVLAVRIREGVLEIRHVEVGSLTQSFEKTIELIKNKFIDENENEIVERYKGILDFRGRHKLSKLYVSTVVSDSNKARIKPELVNDAQMMTMKALVRDKILPALHEYEENPPFRTQKKGSVTLPEGMWLLNTIKAVLDSRLDQIP